MKILVIGKGGREHALGWKVSSSPLCKKLYFLPGNGGTATIGQNIEGDYNDFDFVKSIIDDKDIDLVIVGPEDPIANGISDYLLNSKSRIIAPSSQVAFLESSKIMAKRFMKKYNIPTAEFQVFVDYNEAVRYVKQIKKWPLVIKADGLCGGKGVVIAENAEDALNTIDDFMKNGRFGAASRRIVVEEYLKGYEFSVFAFVDGDGYTILGDAIDYKPALDDDRGPNTGGMGSVSPCIFLTDGMKREVKEKIIERTIQGLGSEGLHYKGFLYFGLMWTEDGPYVLEYNVRMGDPETQALVMVDRRDWLFLFTEPSSLNGKWPSYNRTCVEVVLVSEGYPLKYEKGFEIQGLEDVKDATVFHAGTRIMDNKLITWGGRVLNVVACGKSLSEAREKVYREVKKIRFKNMFYRRDIGDEKRWKGILS